MKVTKKAVSAKAKKVGFDLKIEKGAVTGTRKKKQTPSVDSGYQDLVSVVKTSVQQNNELMKVVSESINTEQAIKSITDIIVSMSDKENSKEDTETQFQTAMLEQASRGKTLKGTIDSRDMDGFIETFTLKVEQG